MIISDMIDFIKAISCSEAAHISTKQRLAKYYKKKLQKYTN